MTRASLICTAAPDDQGSVSRHTAQASRSSRSSTSRLVSVNLQCGAHSNMLLQWQMLAKTVIGSFLWTWRLARTTQGTFHAQIHVGRLKEPRAVREPSRVCYHLCSPGPAELKTLCRTQSNLGPFQMEYKSATWLGMRPQHLSSLIWRTDQELGIREIPKISRSSSGLLGELHMDVPITRCALRS